MKLVKNKLMLAAVTLPLLMISALNAQVEVNFVESGQTVSEKGSFTVGIELSEASLLDVSVPWVVAASSTAVLGSDYEIPEDEEGSGGVVIFDNESPIVFAPGETFKFITVTLLNDDEVENDELLVFELVSDGLTVATLGSNTVYTTRIIDNDPIQAYFTVHEGEYSESGNISVAVRLSESSEQDVEIGYTITPLTANAADLDLSNSFNSVNPITIAAGSSQGTISLKVVNDSVTDRNEGGADKETVRFQINSAQLKDGTAIDFDAEPFIATIVDNDPISVQFWHSEDLVFPVELDEYNTTSVQVRLLDPQGNQTSAADEIVIPIHFGGGVTLGEGENDDMNPNTDPITISAGQSSETVALEINNDDNIEEDELLTITLGAPAYKDGGDVVLDAQNEMSFLIKDNDPVSLSFGASYAVDDRLASEDEDYEDIGFVESAGSIVPERVVQFSIPIYLSSVSGNNTEYRLELLSEGTTATIFDSAGDAEQNYDYRISSHALTKPGDSVPVVIRAGSRTTALTVFLNDDEETPVVFGEEAADDVEADEYVRFRISEINTADSSVIAGNELEYTLTIRDLPDIDITNIMSGLSPDASQLVNGGLPFNDATGLFEAHYVMKPTVTLDPMNYPGYNSLKLQYRTANYDAANPEAESNDAVIELPNENDRNVGDQFHFYVNTPFQLRYPAATQDIKLIDQDDPGESDGWDYTTADTIELSPYILRPLYFPQLNDFEAEIEGAYGVNDELDWLVNFYSKGYFFFPVDRIDPAFNPDRLRVYLTAEETPVFASPGSAATISDFTPLPDGSVYMVINSGVTTSRVQIQYRDPGDKWRVAHPAFINTGGASKLYWIDHGPPQTQTHPKNVSMRLYRAIRETN